jgi:hypothetical protein
MTPLPKLQIIPPASGACFIGMDASKLTLGVTLLDAQRKSCFNHFLRIAISKDTHPHHECLQKA